MILGFSLCYNEKMEKYSVQQVNLMSTDALAYIGDAYFTLRCRLEVLQHHNAKPAKLHLTVTNLVNAHAQSEFLDKITPNLTEEEQDVVRRARNSPTTTKSKNYGLAEYKRATSFEALLGFLYLTNHNRLEEIIKLVLLGVEL